MCTDETRVQTKSSEHFLEWLGSDVFLSSRNVTFDGALYFMVVIEAVNLVGEKDMKV